MRSNRDWNCPWGRSNIGDSLTLIPDICNITRSSIQNIVGDYLGATIRKGHSILSIGGISIAVLIVSIAGTTMVIINLDSIPKLIGWWGIRVDWGCSISWSGNRDRGGSIGWNWSRDRGGSIGSNWSRWRRWRWGSILGWWGRWKV
jgi:hypothetical protein